MKSKKKVTLNKQNKDLLNDYLNKQKKNIIISFISVAIFLACQLSIPLLIGKAIDALGFMDKNNLFVFSPNWMLIYTFLSICIVLALIGVFADFFFEYKVGIITQFIVKDLRSKVFHKINSVSIETIYNKEAGDLLQLEITDIENISTGIFSVLKQLVQGLLQIFITIILMFVTNWILALGVIFLSPLSILMSKFVASFSHKYFSKQSTMMSKLNTYSLETINNTELVQSLNYENECFKNYSFKNDDLRKTSKVAQFSASWTNPTTRLVNNIIYCLIGISGIILIEFSPTVVLFNMTIGKLSTFLTYTNQYTKPFNEISSVLAEFETAKFSFKRVCDFLSIEDDVDNGKGILNDEIESIVFDHMSFSYDKDKKLIEDFNCTIEKGMKVAIVGPTGAGKSTLINVLMRFYDPTSGRILINGIDYTTIKKEELRKHFSMVLQETWIFKGTVKDNLIYGKKEASEEEIIKASKDSHTDTFIETLPYGMDTIVSSKDGLSEGEKQMLTIGRIMLLKNEIVILDEATSNVDTMTEKRINDAFDKLLEGKTSIVIAHRLSTIVKADIILVIKDGQIIEQGSHTDLMGKQGFYYSLFTSQFK